MAVWPRLAGRLIWIAFKPLDYPEKLAEDGIVFRDGKVIGLCSSLTVPGNSYSIGSRRSTGSWSYLDRYGICADG